MNTWFSPVIMRSLKPESWSGWHNEDATCTRARNNPVVYLWYSKKQCIAIFAEIFPDMYVQQLYTGCLSEAAYFIESNGEQPLLIPFVILKPTCNLQRSERPASNIFWNTFSCRLCKRPSWPCAATGATIVYGPGTKPALNFILLQTANNLK